MTSPELADREAVAEWLRELRVRATSPRAAARPRWAPSRPCRCERPLAIADGPSWARCLKCGRDVYAEAPRALRRAPARSRVDVAPLRAAFERSGLTPSEVCHRLGWLERDGATARTSQLTRALGLARPSSSRKRGREYRNGPVRTIDVARAAAIADALHLDPHEVGL